MLTRTGTLTPDREVVTSVKPARASSSRNVPELEKLKGTGFLPATETPLNGKEYRLTSGWGGAGWVKSKGDVTATAAFTVRGGFPLASNCSCWCRSTISTWIARFVALIPSGRARAVLTL